MVIFGAGKLCLKVNELRGCLGHYRPVRSLYETKTMSSLALEQLSLTLKTSASELQELSSLSDAHLLQLNSLIEKAQQTQRKTLSDAIDNAMSYIPALLRIPVMKIVRG